MEISIKIQLLTALYSIVLGVFIGLIYDCFKIFRKFLLFEVSEKLKSFIKKIKLPLISLNFHGENLKTRHKLTYLILDILFFIVITPIMQIFVYAFSNGIVRWYIILGTFVGFIIYYFSVSKIVLSVFEFILLIFKILLSYLLFFIKLPINKCKRILYRKISNFKDKMKAKEIEKTNNSNKTVVFYSGKNNHRL